MSDFPGPIIQRRLWYDNQMRAGDVADEFEVAKERDSLQGLAETL